MDFDQQINNNNMSYTIEEAEVYNDILEILPIDAELQSFLLVGDALYKELCADIETAMK